jgi:EAL domain-containing protein (putative c-di-GMP-specific phosphodiesterase class I)
VPPPEFIALAEESGLIVPLGSRLLRQALRDVMAWSTHPASADCFVSVNVSGVQVAGGGWADDVAAALAETGADPTKLMIELTETASLADLALARSELERVRGLGVRIALDDFGTGHSSLAWLHDLPVDVIKVDRAFVAGLPENPASRRVVEVCVAVANVLDIPLVAEGVETPAQDALVQALRCQWAQGWRYGRPVPAEHLLLAAQTALPPGPRGPQDEPEIQPLDAT